MTDDDFRRLESKVDKLTDAVGKLILFEERQATQGQRLSNAETKIGIHEVSDDMMAEGIRQINQARHILAECLSTKRWPKPEVPYNVMNLPPWFRSPVKVAMPGFEDLF